MVLSFVNVSPRNGICCLGDPSIVPEQDGGWLVKVQKGTLRQCERAAEHIGRELVLCSSARAIRFGKGFIELQ